VIADGLIAFPPPPPRILFFPCGCQLLLFSSRKIRLASSPRFVQIQDSAESLPPSKPSSFPLFKAISPFSVEFSFDFFALLLFGDLHTRLTSLLTLYGREDRPYPLSERVPVSPLPFYRVCWSLEFVSSLAGVTFLFPSDHKYRFFPRYGKACPWEWSCFLPPFSSSSPNHTTGNSLSSSL